MKVKIKLPLQDFVTEVVLPCKLLCNHKLASSIPNTRCYIYMIYVLAHPHQKMILIFVVV